jgi:hypothetical protein
MSLPRLNHHHVCSGTSHDNASAIVIPEVRFAQKILAAIVARQEAHRLLSHWHRQKHRFTRTRTASFALFAGSTA